jgi:hypothetical protein
VSRPKGSKNKPKDSPDSAESPAENPVDNQPVVSEVTKEPSPPAVQAHTKRGALLKEINEINKEKYAADEGPIDQIELSEPEETPEPEVEAVEAKPEPKETPLKRKFIVDGVEKEFTDEEITAYVQKHATADKRLAEATRLREDAQRAIQTTSKPVNQPSSSDDVGSEDISRISRALIAGEESEVQEAVATLLRSGRHSTTQSQIAPQQIHGMVAETIAFERAKTLLETPPEQGGYADIWTNPMLQDMFKMREEQLRAQNDSRSYSELYSAIGTELRTWRDDLVKKHLPPTGLENRDQLKRSTGIVRGAGGKLPTVPLESRPKTHEEKLNGMRAARGLN